ncbi:hypothetical protein LVB87_14630 [Lysobacter sp. KIS68-7]|uniref:hypothetical protein n=1 Tax=Lysobacter sp. KIS68-7 TaxID=2904252 RepID=UPI001E2ABEE8|nr:hypothetical protein [Lysobacter sp. KIS68-7]UHQ19404.1 hypothetical protein LVB87_14630 [Lysobacter sp. KIS68-7]
MARPYDDQNKKLARPMVAPDQFAQQRADGNLGPLGETIARGMSNVAANLAARNATYNAPTGAKFNTGLGVLDSSPKLASPAAAPTPGRKPVPSTDGVAPTGGVPASPPVVKPVFASARGRLLTPPVAPAAQPTGIQRTMVNGVPTFTGTGGYSPQAPVAAPAVSRTLLSSPSIAPVMTPSVTNQSESTDQRRARDAAISEIGTQLFLNRGKTTRSARDLTSDLLKTQADLTNTAGNQAVALKNSNLDAQSRMDVVGLQNQGENDRALVDVRGTNERTSLLNAGDTERERLKLERPSLLTDRDGAYLLLNPLQSVGRPVLSDGQQVRGLVDGAITPVDRLTSLQGELTAAQQSLTPDPVRIGDLERQVDALRRPSAAPVPGDVVKGFRFRGGDPSIAANWERIGGAP